MSPTPFYGGYPHTQGYVLPHQGWQCSDCYNIYSPFVAACTNCQNKQKATEGAGDKHKV